MLESGHTIADYQIVKPLAENQLFTTYQVTGPLIDSAQLLLVDEEQLVDKKTRLAFITQGQILCGQSFPGLNSLIAADSTDEYSYCLYPATAGSSLTERLAEQLTVRESLVIVRQIADFLSPAHASGLCHGSISPATIYLDAGTVLLDQFALASLLTLDFHSGIDPCYSSPELVRGERPDSASDLYSLGIVLYRLLAGRVPFLAEDPFATAMLHVQEQAEPLQGVLSLLQPLLDGLLAPVSGDRWSADKLTAELDHYLQLAELDQLTSATPVQESTNLEPQTQVEDTTKIEQIVTQSDMASRIEKRLQERAEILQQTAQLTPDAKRASTARMSAIGQQSYRKSQHMQQHQYQKKSGPSRIVLLISLGIAVGVVIYLLLFQPQAVHQQDSAGEQQALLDGLEQGSRQLEEKDFAAAEKIFLALAEEFTLSPQPYNNLAAIYAQQGDLEQARNLLERAMATDASYATIYGNLGTVYAEMARDSYGRALQLEKGQQAVTLQVFDGTKLLALNTAGSLDVKPTVAAITAVTVEQGGAHVVNAEVVSGTEQKVAAAVVVASEQKVVTETPQVTAEIPSVTEGAKPSSESVNLPTPESAEQFLGHWAAAWSSQNVVAYLDFYATDFTPSSGISREEWAEQRETRLTRPRSISVSLDDFSMVRQAGEQMQVEVTQNYQSDRYADRTRKLFDLFHDGGNWQIVHERSLGRVR